MGDTANPKGFDNEKVQLKEDVPVPLTIENVARLNSPNGGERFSIPITVSVPDPLVPETGGTRPQ